MKRSADTKLNVLDLFSGIGGFSLGLDRTGGFRTVAFCEIEPYAQKVLAKNWPGVPIYEDVKELTGERLRADGISVDVITGGFPCQDISHAGKGAGIEGERSGLWSEIARLIGELRPRYAIMENVSALLGRGLDVVLGDLAEIGYDAEWHCITASSVGAPHIRDRIWIVAHSDIIGLEGESYTRASSGQGSRVLKRKTPGPGNSSSPADVPDSVCGISKILGEYARMGWVQKFYSEDGPGVSPWAVESNVCRVANGIPSRVDRLRCLGNAVVPQIPELIGYAILEKHNDR